ncbi:hypothetical protein SERLA73DRAFT_71569 [Serpula lacrymans var. lacrymans S7.3]|uniref:Bromo domain-containing protein n=2 Tax=Serpula lacrymans var. lacrymans TaxID=341189 RepID=F8PRD6_SERL3|nr:uncharacterized protein SERLADRAFT_435953 [Serpula lacrymans var. lacrymans S7.9]EGO00559.1 hypothetical protein SERLA73DRAFT_71569 [Serpula lacrymans var. lacrymans S7.3]EGO26112.1 hypothetical protein SERLADRAFT_435953 [Serpula lacrymans var. lacrymans S7.9]
MNNLLRALTESQVKSSADLKLLLTTVKEARRQSYDTKISEPFYESLEGLLHDLRTVTMDNHDADAFLKPVPRAEYPDYYDVIANPMDLQTMLKKVKGKQYKSKREFKDDLDLIWSNCYTYNANEDHPLRLCAKRLKMKADKLLMNITDRKERVDPYIPFDLSSRNTPQPKLNGFMNGHLKPRSPSRPPRQPISIQSTCSPVPKKPRRDVAFPDSPAIIRTAEGMVTFRQMDEELNATAGPSFASHAPARGLSNGVSSLPERLRSYAMPIESESETEDERLIDSAHTEGDAAGKRKINGITAQRPRKRARLTPPVYDNSDVLDLWWRAVESDTLLANGLPSLVQSSHQAALLSQPTASRSPSRKRKRPKKSDTPTNTMLAHMNGNIKTLKRVRRTHAKFAALNLNSEEGGTFDEPPDVPEDEVEETIDERPWKTRGAGVEIGEANATDCLRWMNTKVLEHAGFQGSSSVALDVLSGVTSEFFLNVGRTLRFLCDKYSNSMTAEEIILHTLFESGTTKIQNLERYIKDDVIRYGARLTDLEKKLVSAYREATAVEALDDDALFGNDSEEEEGAFVMGNFTDSFGEDFLGLRELGIAAEFGLSSLSIPKKLLKGKGKAGSKLLPSEVKPTEPPPPYPPPPSFLLVSSKNVDDHIGLLKTYYQGRLSLLSSSLPPMASAPSAYPPAFASAMPPLLPQPAAPKAVVTLPDDSSNPVQSKLGPLGQVLKSGSSANALKKKGKGKDGTISTKPEETALVDSSLYEGGSVTDSPKKKKPANGPSAKKKKAVDFPPVIAASA